MAPLRLEIGGPGARRLWRTIVVTLGLSIVAVLILVELIFRRWAPWASNQGMSALVAMVWSYHLLPILKRERSVLGGLGRALLYAGGTAVLLAVGLSIAP